MSLINEYITKRLSVQELESELLRLISEYNKHRETYLFVYAAAIGKPIPSVSLEQSDFYLIQDLLRNKKDINKVEFYIETPGGSGETAEEIVKFLRDNFDTVSFVVSGEAKSAGTIIVLSGDEILMTETGSLGPIDAQVRIGRSVVSASDYMDWVKIKMDEAGKQGNLNPFDATMIAQISPGELGNVFHALEFAKDLVVEWLPKYKFKNWNVTETQKKPVTDEMKQQRAKEIAEDLTKRFKWRTHGGSIKIDELTNDVKLKIIKIDNDLKLSDIVYRIQTVCRLLFESTSTFKVFATQDDKIFRQAVPVSAPIRIPKNQTVDIAEIEQKCPKCGETYKIYAKFVPNPKIDVDFKNKGFIPFPKDDRIICNCGFEIDLLGIKNQIEIQTGRKVIVE
jgi:hypothetical protein